MHGQTAKVAIMLCKWMWPHCYTGNVKIYEVKSFVAGHWADKCCEVGETAEMKLGQSLNHTTYSLKASS